MNRPSVTTRIISNGVGSISGATTIEDPEAVRNAALPRRQWNRSAPLRSMLVATMISLDDIWLSRPRLEANTVNQLVIYWDEEHEDVAEIPPLCIVWPRRQTFRFSAAHPLTILPVRRPFIPVGNDE